ncbi:helix-turn-helix domain-containing protein [Virgibacillus sp. 6R]|uniref:helix-turn-helix domain-containing protein n=1 Tax=Metabacillus sp. 22489 TaxID=3453928 RepID=UPI0021056759
MDLRIRGVLIYECDTCGTFFSVSLIQNVSCPGCKGSNITQIGDGVTSYNEPKKEFRQKENSVAVQSEKKKEFLRVEDITDLLDVSLTKAYELMREPDFPSMNLGGIKRVRREAFFKWLQNRENNKYNT